MNRKEQADLTQLVTRFDLNDAERLGLSATGHRIVIGTRGLFTVLDWPAKKVLAEGEGRFPALSPDGERLAFVTVTKDLIVLNLVTGEKKSLLKGVATYGVGAWSPDSSILLVGAATSTSSMFGKLVAVDVDSDTFAEVVNIGEGGFGADFVWIKRNLIR